MFLLCEPSNSDSTEKSTIIDESDLNFVDRGRSAANQIYSAIELSLSVFPFETIRKELIELRNRIRKQGRADYLRRNPEAKLDPSGEEQ